jgi:hypothetical protein
MYIYIYIYAYIYINMHIYVFSEHQAIPKHRGWWGGAASLLAAR